MVEAVPGFVEHHFEVERLLLELFDLGLFLVVCLLLLLFIGNMVLLDLLK